MKKLPGWAKTVLKVSVSLTLLVLFVRRVQTGHLVEAFASLAWWQVCVAALAYLVSQFISSLRWLLLARSMGIPASVWPFYDFYLQGMFYSLFLPTSIGGDVGRAVLLSKLTQTNWLKATLSILSERASGFCGLYGFLWAGMALFTFQGFDASSKSLISAIGLFALVFTLGFKRVETLPGGHWLIHKVLFKKASDTEVLGQIWPQKRIVLTTILMSIGLHSLNTLILWSLLGALGGQVSYLLMGTIYALAAISAMLPITLSGIGVREGVMVILLTRWAGVPEETAVALSLLWLSLIILTTFPGAVLALRHPLTLKVTSQS